MTVNSTRDFIPPEPFEGQNYKPRYARPSASLREELLLLSLGKLSGRKRCPVKPQTTLSVRQTFCYKTNYKSLTVTNKTNKVVNRLIGT